MELSNLRALFISEGREVLQRVDTGLRDLGQSHDAQLSVDELFRAMHSLKGMTATVGWRDASDALHAGESVLVTVRDGAAITLHQYAALVALAEQLRDAIDAFEHGRETAGAFLPLTARLEMSRDRERQRVLPRREGSTADTNLALSAERPAVAAWRVDVTIAEDAALPGARSGLVIRRLAALGAIVGVSPDGDARLQDGWNRRMTVWMSDGPTRRDLEATASACGDVAAVRVARAQAARDEQPGHVASAATVRIPARRLDHLLDLVGELVIARDRLVASSESRASDSASGALDDASRLIMQLRDAVVVSRMVPLADVFSRFHRLVRDTGRALGKEVALVIEGGDLEVDRSLLDELTDPLTHLIRNALDHGLELPDERRRAGKAPRGTIILRAQRDGGMIVVEVSDDGRGVNRDLVVASAAAHGVTGAAAMARDDHGLLQLLARPGLSTAAAVTELSGRGVGMDAVSSRVRSRGGRLALATTLGTGTTVTIRLPLSIAMIRALMVRVEAETYAIPLQAVHSTMLTRDVTGIAAGQLSASVTVEGEAVRVVSLRATLGLPPRHDVSGHLIVLTSATGRYALDVDRCVTQREIVVKSMPRVRGAMLFSGGTILPDGSPSLILDINAIT